MKESSIITELRQKTISCTMSDLERNNELWNDQQWITHKHSLLFPYSLLLADCKYLGNPIFSLEFYGNENYRIPNLFLILMRHTYNWNDIRMLYLLHGKLTYSLVMLNFHRYQKQLKLKWKNKEKGKESRKGKRESKREKGWKGKGRGEGKGKEEKGKSLVNILIYFFWAAKEFPTIGREEGFQE